MFTEADIDKFQDQMKERLAMGREQYGDNYLKKNLVKEMREELLDLANYSFMLAHKIERVLSDG